MTRDGCNKPGPAISLAGALSAPSGSRTVVLGRVTHGCPNMGHDMMLEPGGPLLPNESHRLRFQRERLDSHNFVVE
jgi:hypothetical protein